MAAATPNAPNSQIIGSRHHGTGRSGSSGGYMFWGPGHRSGSKSIARNERSTGASAGTVRRRVQALRVPQRCHEEPKTGAIRGEVVLLMLHSLSRDNALTSLFGGRRECRDAIEPVGTDRFRLDPARRGPPSPAGLRGKV
jgi:hypothetical protein